MSVSQVSQWVVRCDTDPRHVIGGDGGMPVMFYSYHTAVILAQRAGWAFTPEDGVLCPTCKEQQT